MIANINDDNNNNNNNNNNNISRLREETYYHHRRPQQPRQLIIVPHYYVNARTDARQEDMMCDFLKKGLAQTMLRNCGSRYFLHMREE